MATQIDRARVWLDASGIKKSNNPLWQVIDLLIRTARETQIEVADVVANPVTPPSGGITALTTDVVATGPGIAVATIQPDAVTTIKIIDDAIITDKILDSNVTYAKIQDVSAGQRLLGRDVAAGAVEEIQLGTNLSIDSGVLEVEAVPGVPGLDHDLLSTTHPDTDPDAPVIGDIIRAVEGEVFAGTYFQFVIPTALVEDFVGVRAGYMYGMNGVSGLNANFGGYAPPELSFVTEAPADVWLSWNVLNYFIQTPLVEDFEGVRAGYDALVPGGTVPGSGNSGGYSATQLDFIAPPTPSHDTGDAVWQRLPIADEDDVLTIVDGLPEWAPLPTPVVYPIVHPWTTIPFDAADFTADGGVTPTWTVAAGDIGRFQYQYFEGESGIGNNVRIAVYLRNTTVGGTAPTQLRIELPFNLIGEWGQFISLQENTVGVFDAFVAYGGAIPSNFLYIQKVPFGGAGPVFDTTADETYLSFEISAVLAP